MAEWQMYAKSGDQWLIAYASVYPMLWANVNLFLVGQAVELYLKSTHIKLFGNEQKTINFCHNLKAIWDECKAADANFMNGWDIDNSIYRTCFIEAAVVSALAPIDQEQFATHQCLYTIMKHLAELKYFGLKWYRTIP